MYTETMTFDGGELSVVDEVQIDLYCRRLEHLLEAGYSIATADVLSGDPEVDLARACRLLACGCSEKTAFAILS